MPRANEPDFAPALVECVEQFVGMHPGNAENHIDPVFDQRIDDRLRRGYEHLHLKVLAGSAAIRKGHRAPDIGSRMHSESLPRSCSSR